MAGKTWEELTIQNNFIFGKSMETSPKICKWLLEKILHMKIRELTYPEREKSIDVRRDSKGIRLDVFVQEADGESSYDLEMQVIGQDDLPKRIRYYQGLIDMDAMDKGHYYWMLGKTAIIFICTFDYFGEGRHIYTFHQRCDEDNAIRLQDGTTKVFLNACGTMDDVDDDLKAFLDYVAGKQVSHPMVDELDTVVQKVKHNKDWRSEYMRYEHELAAREHLAREDGRKEGLEEGKMEMVLEMLRENQPLAFISKISKYSIDKIAEIGKLNGLPLTK